MCFAGAGSRALLLAASLLAPCLVAASPTGLNLVPTADVVGSECFSVELEAVGHATPFAAGGERALLTEFGLNDRIEVGLDRLLSHGTKRTCLDAKAQLLRREQGDLAVAAGVTDLTRWDGTSSVWYLVGTRDFGPTRATLGLQRDGQYRTLVGFARSLTDSLCLQADWVTGRDGCAALGLVFELPGDWEVLAFAAHGNTNREGDFVGLNLAWNGRWCRRCEAVQGALAP
jgi:hypothetical protein